MHDPLISTLDRHPLKAAGVFSPARIDRAQPIILQSDGFRVRKQRAKRTHPQPHLSHHQMPLDLLGAQFARLAGRRGIPVELAGIERVGIPNV
jgi:hypothetical protein